MSSILTNNSAMVALQTLKSINSNLGKIQSEISTGKTIESAKDNAATWAISKVMESDVAGFKAISDSLSLGQSTVGVAINAAESITDLLTEVKGKVVNAQEDNVDRAKIQTDIEALTNQINSIAGAAQFNGLSLLSNTDSTAGTGTSDILSSLDRSATGVTASQITVNKQDLGTGAFVDGGTPGAVTATAATAAAALTDGSTSTSIYDVAAAPTLGDSFIINSAGGGNAADFGDPIQFTVLEGDTQASVRDKLITYLNYAAAKSGQDVTYQAEAGQVDGITVTNNTGANITTLTSDISTQVQAAGQVGAGGLSLLNNFDVTTEDGAAAALAGIEGLIQTSIDSAAVLGSAGKRIDTQNEFMGKLSDLLTSGIGTLVDADMEAASAKLQALQTQQQLGVQALSIANQAPQTILSLFR